MVDPKDIIEQKAFEMINYVLKLNDSSTKESEDSSFSNTKPGTVADDKPINTNTSNDDFYTSNDVISAYGESLSNSNFKKLINDYFMYFYDVTSDQDNSLSFKLGFINKQDTKKRFTNYQNYKINQFEKWL
ncbi:hypothetical protein NWP96_04190 [Mycoplasmopsis cynos]|nr:hypothetical protein [Mycoplasmopsis cynos]